MPKVKLCHCGKPLHYTNPGIQREMEKMVEALGEFTRIRVGNRTWLVSRHYIALHGVIGGEIEKLGFQEVPNRSDEEGVFCLTII